MACRWRPGPSPDVVVAIASRGQHFSGGPELRGLADDPGQAAGVWEALTDGDRERLAVAGWDAARLGAEIVRLWRAAVAGGVPSVILEIGQVELGTMKDPSLTMYLRAFAVNVGPVERDGTRREDWDWPASYLVKFGRDGVLYELAMPLGFGHPISAWDWLPVDVRGWFAAREGWDREAFNAAVRRYGAYRVRLAWKRAYRNNYRVMTLDLAGDLAARLDRFRRKRGGRVTRRQRKAAGR